MDKSQVWILRGLQAKKNPKRCGVPSNAIVDHYLDMQTGWQVKGRGSKYATLLLNHTRSHALKIDMVPWRGDEQHPPFYKAPCCYVDGNKGFIPFSLACWVWDYTKGYPLKFGSHIKIRGPQISNPPPTWSPTIIQVFITCMPWFSSHQHHRVLAAWRTSLPVLQQCPPETKAVAGTESIIMIAWCQVLDCLEAGLLSIADIYSGTGARWRETFFLFIL